MKFILLSGGSGKRLWPLSNNTRSKQFLKLIPNINGENESMVQRIFRQLSFCGVDEKDIYISTSKDQIDSIKRQLNSSVNVIIEPSQRNTFPAIALSCAYLHFVEKCSLDEEIIILPVDPYTDLTYFETLLKMGKMIKSSTYDLILMGIKPTYPSEKYGYIAYDNNENESVKKVTSFIEKPSKDVAINLISNDALWNGGVFALKLQFIIDRLVEYFKVTNYDDLLTNYEKLPKISFDYEIVEKSNSVGVLTYDGNWIDLGTWNTLTEHMNSHIIGNVISGENSINTHVINELEIPVITLGVSDLVIVSNYDGILVSKKSSSSYLKPYVEKLDNLRPMYKERRWGEYKIIDYHKNNGLKSLTKHITIDLRNHTDYVHHTTRREILTFIEGKGIVILDDSIINVEAGDVVVIEKGSNHLVKALCKLHYIEVQIGTSLDEDDNIRIDISKVFRQLLEEI